MQNWRRRMTHTHNSPFERKIDVLDKSRLNQFLLRPMPLVQQHTVGVVQTLFRSTINSIYPSGLETLLSNKGLMTTKRSHISTKYKKHICT